MNEVGIFGKTEKYLIMRASIYLLFSGIIFLFSSCTKSPEPAFSHISSNKYIEGSNIMFQNESIDAESYLWDFGDGTTSTEENPTHSYNSPGSYQVTLTAFNKKKESSISELISITSFGNKGSNNYLNVTYDGKVHTFRLIEARRYYERKDEYVIEIYGQGEGSSTTTPVIKIRMINDKTSNIWSNTNFTFSATDPKQSLTLVTKDGTFTTYNYGSGSGQVKSYKGGYKAGSLFQGDFSAATKNDAGEVKVLKNGNYLTTLVN